MLLTNSSRVSAILATAVALVSMSSARGGIDNLETILSNNVATGGTTNSFACYGYVESRDDNNNLVKTFYTATFGSGAAVRKIVEGSGTSSIVANEGDIQLFYRNGDTTRGVTTAILSGMITNPAPVGSIGTDGALWITDAATTRNPGLTTTDPAASKRLYRYNLQAVPAGGDGRDVFTSLLTLSDMDSLAGAAATNTTSNFGRQAAFSPNGQSIYAVDTTSQLGGVYRTDPITGVSSRVLNVSSAATGAVRLANEPAVLRVGDVDRVLISGNRVSSADPDMNVGGLNYFDYDGTTASPQHTLIAAADLQSFLQTTAATEVRAVAAAPDGTIFFWEGAATARMIARDPQGRFYKITTRTERDQFFTGSTTTTPTPTLSVLRLQTRAINHPTAGAITQLMYAESTPLNFVAAVDVFKPTDFDRDGDEDVADMTAFGQVLTPTGVASSLDNARFDLNGNGSIDYHDVRSAQSFQLFPDGDTNFDQSVNFDDLLSLAQHYGTTTGMTWLQGDFNGDNGVTFDDLLTLAQHYSGSSPMLNGAGVSAGFAADWALAQSLVPEPVSLTFVAASASLLARRRRRD